jgi:hypothetical protein
VPGGLYYTAKIRFRSSALLCFGAPITVTPEPLGPDGEPEPDHVRALTARLEEALARVTLQADQEDALRLVTRAERIFSSTEGPGTVDRDLRRQFQLRKRFLGGYSQLKRTAPKQVEFVERLLARYDAELSAAGLAPENLLESRLTPGMVVKNASIAVASLLLLAPLAVIGIVIHYPAYLVTGPLATRTVKVQRDVIAIAKIFAAMALYPLVWLAIAGLTWRYRGLAWGVAALLIAPCTGYAALRFLEGLDRLIGSARGLSLRLFRPSAFRRLEAQRQKIREAILELDGKLE